MQMKILVIFTGGTIGSASSDGFISPNEKSKRKLIEKYRGSYCGKNTNDIEFEFIEPYNILSENITAKELNLLLASVRGALNENCENAENFESAGNYESTENNKNAKMCKYDGIIITHGTDTIQYTAAALGYAFFGAKIPIVLVSAAYPLDDERSNGVTNFAAAAEFIKMRKCGGVFVSYKNDGDDYVSIHYALRLFTHNENDDALKSVGGELAAKFFGGKILCEAEYAAEHKGSFEESFAKHFKVKFKEGFKGDLKIRFRKAENENSRGGICFTLCEKPSIKVVSAVVGDDFSDIELKNKSAVIIRPYHSGTIGNISGIKELCRRAAIQNVPVFLVNLKEAVRYESTREYENAGLIILPEAAFCAIYMKAWIAKSLNKNIEEFVKIPIGNEFVLPKDKDKEKM